jgi:hypothetical protein
MRRDVLLELHYITHFENIISIRQGGILSHNQAESIPHNSVADEIIQSRRRSKSVPGGRHLHDYVNLYFHGRNPMLFKLKHKYGYSQLCVLSISPEVLNLSRVIITSCNASSDYALFKPAPEGLDIVDEELVFARYWTHPDQFEKWRRASIKCAEVLVPDCVDKEFISKAYVSCRDSKIMLERIMRDAGLNLNVEINADLFFG